MPTAPLSPAPDGLEALVPGAHVEAVARLALHRQPGDEAALVVLDAGDTAVLQLGPVEIDGDRWYLVAAEGVDGWVIASGGGAEYLRLDASRPRDPGYLGGGSSLTEPAVIVRETDGAAPARLTWVTVPPVPGAQCHFELVLAPPQAGIEIILFEESLAEIGSGELSAADDQELRMAEAGEYTIAGTGTCQWAVAVKLDQ